MPDIRIEIDGTRARLYVGNEEITDRASGYTLTHQAGKAAELQVTFNAFDVSVNGDALVIIPESIRSFFEKDGDKGNKPIEMRVTELEQWVQARPKDIGPDAIVSLLERQIHEMLSVDQQ